MMNRILISSVLCSLALSTANAYQLELGADAGYIDTKNSSSGHSFGVNGTYYFKNLPSNTAPLAESAFIQKANNVSANVAWADLGKTELSTYQVAGEYYLPNTQFYTSANLARHHVEVPVGALKAESDVNTYGAEIGYLPMDNFLVAVGLTGYKADDDKGVNPTVRAKYLSQFAGKAINLEAGAKFGDLDEYNLKADYYLDNTFSVGADYFNNDLSKTSEFGVNAKKFVNPQLSLDGRIGFTEVGADDAKNFAIGAKYRF